MAVLDAPPTPFTAVAIGSSAGGVDALFTVVSALPPALPATVLIVQHLDPNRRSMLAALLGRRARLPVEEARNGQVVAASTIYVAPPGFHLVVHGGRLALTGTEVVHFTRPSVDTLFMSVAEEYAQHAIGVILTGTGTDGAAGVRAIKARGGVTIVEDPASAAHAGMPGAAVATGCVDLTLPLGDIGPTIARLVLAGAGAKG